MTSYDVTLRLWHILKPRLAEEGLVTVYETLERGMPAVLADMERAGIRVDPDRLKRLSSEFGMRMAELETRAHALAGRPFNVGSPRQIGDILLARIGEAAATHLRAAFEQVPERNAGGDLSVIVVPPAVVVHRRREKQ